MPIVRGARLEAPVKGNQGRRLPPGMSVIGTKQTYLSTLNMSAFGGKADIPDRLPNVRSTQSGHSDAAGRKKMDGQWPPTQAQPTYVYGRLFRDAHKEGAGQFAVCPDKRCVVGLVVMTKNGRRSDVGVFFD
jgi:hypothetical protein